MNLLSTLRASDRDWLADNASYSPAAIRDLVLQDGVRADSRRLLPQSWIDAMTAAGPEFADCGYLWWRMAWPDGAADVYAPGIFGQVLFVSRQRDTVVLRTGSGEGGQNWPLLIRAIVDALP